MYWSEGYCAATAFGGDCSTGDQGAWLATTAEKCVDECRSCERCQFVSYKKAEHECSWYSECDVAQLQLNPAGFRTREVVRKRPNGRGGSDRKPFETSRPSALIVYHTAKTGGTSLLGLLLDLHRRRGQLAPQSNERWPGFVFKYGTERCFFSLFPDLFPRYAHSWHPPLCGNRRTAWRSANVVLEAHDLASRLTFWRELAPQLPALRRLYASANGTLVTTVAVRAPESHLRSYYRMWPPQLGGGKVQLFAEFLSEPARGALRGKGDGVGTAARLAMPTASGLQAHSLVPEATASPSRPWARLLAAASDGGGGTNASATAAWASETACPVAVASKRLHGFDVVGLTECTAQLWQRLSGRLGWGLNDDFLRGLLERRQAPKQSEHYLPAAERARSEASLAAPLSTPREQRALRRATACDARLYADAVRIVRGAASGGARASGCSV